MNIEFRLITWWYWLVTVAFLAAFLAGWSPGIQLAMAVTALHGWHYLRRGQTFGSFAVQVRIAYVLLLAAGLWAPLAFIHWLQLGGTLARLLFAYCPLARIMSLMPWNRSAPLTWPRVWRTITLPPVAGSVLEVLNGANIRPGLSGAAARGETA